MRRKLGRVDEDGHKRVVGLVPKLRGASSRAPQHGKSRGQRSASCQAGRRLQPTSGSPTRRATGVPRGARPSSGRIRGGQGGRASARIPRQAGLATRAALPCREAPPAGPPAARRDSGAWPWPAARCEGSWRLETVHGLRELPSSGAGIPLQQLCGARVSRAAASSCRPVPYCSNAARLSHTFSFVAWPGCLRLWATADALEGKQLHLWASSPTAHRGSRRRAWLAAAASRPPARALGRHERGLPPCHSGQQGRSGKSREPAPAPPGGSARDAACVTGVSG